MAEFVVGGAFLSSVLQVIYERLASKDFRNYFSDGVVKIFEITLVSINKMLDDAETKQYQDLSVKNWLDDLKHVVYELEQLLDVIATERQRKGTIRHFVSGYFNRYESRAMIKVLLQKLQFLAKEKDILGLQEATLGNYVTPWKLLNEIQTVSLADESVIYGREYEKKEIINFLFENSDSDNGQVSIISIVGLGGMGKTTLAQLVYNDDMIEEQFEIKVWVCVSKSFDLVPFTQSILRTIHYSEAYSEELEILQRQLQQRLMSKRYLLVLDDVWNKDSIFWDIFLLPFIRGSSRGKVIVTTRDKEVASIIESTRLLHLKQLEEGDCWSLFVKYAFQGRDVFEYPNLELIGKKIVKNCGGLPLALKTLGISCKKISLKLYGLRYWRLIYGVYPWVTTSLTPF